MTQTTTPTRDLESEDAGVAPETLSDLLARRHSARAFTDRPVPEALVVDVLAKAQRTPSWCNTQPWTLHLLSPEKRDALSEMLLQRVATDVPRADLGMPSYVGAAADRRRESGFALYEALGIEREDKDARLMQMLKNFSFFGAPRVIIVTTPVALGTYGALDCGGWLAVVQLLLAEAGLGSIAQGAVAQYSDVVREFLGLDESQAVVVALSFGYEDEDEPVNAFRTSRVLLEETVRHVM